MEPDVSGMNIDEQVNAGRIAMDLWIKEKAKTSQTLKWCHGPFVNQKEPTAELKSKVDKMKEHCSVKG